MRLQTSIAKSVSIQGLGIHTGTENTVVLHPAPAGAGISFITQNGVIQASAHNVGTTTRCTTLVQGDASLSTVEHLMSAAWGMGIDNMAVEVNGCEMPILDGSAESWCKILDEAGKCRQELPIVRRRLRVPVKMQCGDSSAWAFPADCYSVSMTTYFDHPMIGLQAEDVVCDKLDYRAEVASARTFGFIEEVEQLLAAGLAKGGSLDNALVIYRDRYSSPLRYHDEVLRHKLLDMLGDMNLIGGQANVHVVTVYPSHRLNTALARAILDNSEIIEP